MSVWSFPQLGNFPFTGGEKDKDGLAIGAIGLSDFKIDFPSKAAAEPPLSFIVHQLSLKHVGPNRVMTFQIALHNPKPAGDVRSDGQFGPLNTDNVGLTPLAGAFTFQNADLTVEGAISGILNASGKFEGRLGGIEGAGTADIPRFQVPAAAIRSTLQRDMKFQWTAETGIQCSNRSRRVLMAPPFPHPAT